MDSKDGSLGNHSDRDHPAYLVGLEMGVEMSSLIIIRLNLSLRNQPKYIQDIVEELDWYLGRRRIRI